MTRCPTWCSNFAFNKISQHTIVTILFNEKNLIPNRISICLKIYLIICSCFFLNCSQSINITTTDYPSNNDFRVVLGQVTSDNDKNNDQPTNDDDDFIMILMTSFYVSIMSQMWFLLCMFSSIWRHNVDSTMTTSNVYFGLGWRKKMSVDLKKNLATSSFRLFLFFIWVVESLSVFPLSMFFDFVSAEMPMKVNAWVKKTFMPCNVCWGRRHFSYEYYFMDKTSISIHVFSWT